MDRWGAGLLGTISCVAEMAARGWRLPHDAFAARMARGPHLLAPTGVDLGRAPREGDVFAGYHYDLNFLTAHGASRYPGLHAWLRSGRRVAVRIPRGCLLLQAGKQMEWLTGGHVRAGFHEVRHPWEGRRQPGPGHLIHVFGGSGGYGLRGLPTRWGTRRAPPSPFD